LSFEDDEALRALEAEGTAMRARCGGRELWAHRRLLARVRRAMVERLRAAVQPVSKADYEQFLPPGSTHAHDGAQRARGASPRRCSSSRAPSFPAPVWEQDVLPRHLQSYHREWLDQATLSGEFVWLRLWGPWRGPLSKCALSIVPRAELPLWLELPLERAQPAELGAAARTLHEVLQQRGAVFPTDLQTHSACCRARSRTGSPN
jgi:ATP-dependent Lhr-like helicase